MSTTPWGTTSTYVRWRPLPYLYQVEISLNEIIKMNPLQNTHGFETDLCTTVNRHVYKE